MKNLLFPIVLMLLVLPALCQDKDLHKGNLLYLQSQYERAEEKYRTVLKKDSANIIAQFNLANSLHKQKKYDQATIITAKVAGSASDQKLRSAAYYNQGVAYTKLKNLEASIASYKNALKLNPNDTEARENLQKALLEQKKQKQQQQQKQPKSKMSQKEAEQKLKLLQQKEKQIQERLQNKNKQTGKSQGQDW